MMFIFIFLLSYFCAIGWWLMLLSPEWAANGAVGFFVIGYLLDQSNILEHTE